MNSVRRHVAPKSHPEFRVKSSKYSLVRRSSGLSKKVSASSGTGHPQELVGWIE